MVREMVTVHVGQCGNQIGRRFWTELLHEAAACQHDRPENQYDASMSAFFLNADSRHEYQHHLGVGSQPSCLRARALLIDTEERVLSETLRDPIVGGLFRETQLISDTGGAGNNWAQGFAVYGPKCQDAIEEAARGALESCDSPQAFLCMHSVGGGTGAGLGSFALELLQDFFPELCRVTISVYPSENENVVTAPYNAVLTTQRLTQTADCVLAMENSAMLKLCARQTHGDLPSRRHGKVGYGEINDVAAQLLSNLTAGSRYSGRLNIDLNEISTNLVPFQPLKYLTASFAPLLAREWDVQSKQSRNSKQAESQLSASRLFSDACSSSSKLIQGVGTNRTIFSYGVFARGDIGFADIVASSERLRSQLLFPRWNPDGFKVGLCATPPLRTSRTILCLENSTGIASSFENLRGQFNKLYQAKAMLHHYTKFIETSAIVSALHDFDELIQNYKYVPLDRP